MAKQKNIITKLIEQGEGLKLDFKFEVSDAAKIARSLTAFANTVGGVLLIGVNDDGSISGIKSEEELFMIEKAASNYCFPPVIFSSRNWRINGKNVLKIDIPKSIIAPHKAPDHNNELKVFVRIDDQNMLANGIQMKIWKKLNDNTDVSFNYTDEAQMLLKILDENKSFSLAELLTLMKLSKYKVENMIAELVIMKVIKMTVSIDKVLFSLSDPLE